MSFSIFLVLSKLQLLIEIHNGFEVKPGTKGFNTFNQIFDFMISWTPGIVSDILIQDILSIIIIIIIIIAIIIIIITLREKC